MELVRILYASKSNNIYPQVKDDLMQILDAAVDFNYRHSITGVLYYGNGYFFQCMEGPKDIVDELFYNKIIKDKRHKNCEILSYITCKDVMFKDWSMKFAPVNRSIKKFFSEQCLDEFNPYLLSCDMVPDFLNILIDQPNALPHEYAPQ